MGTWTVTIPSRFRGPPNSANGGYAAGTLAEGLPGAVTVRLQRPPPLDRPLEIRPGETPGTRRLMDGETLLARAGPGQAPAATLSAVTPAEAAAAAARTFAATRHPIPGCFVCGPGRGAGDGLRIHVGPLDPGDAGWDGTLAAPWVPSVDLGGPDGRVRVPFLWAALDCPTAYACSSAAGMPPILLGEQTVELLAQPRVGERCVIVTRGCGAEGRKHYSEAALFDAHGACLARCRALWIAVSQAVIDGAA